MLDRITDTFALHSTETRTLLHHVRQKQGHLCITFDRNTDTFRSIETRTPSRYARQNHGHLCIAFDRNKDTFALRSTETRTPFARQKHGHSRVTFDRNTDTLTLRSIETRTPSRCVRQKHGLTFSSDRNPLWTPSNQTSRHFVFKDNKPAMSSVQRCYLPPPQVSVWRLFQLCVK